MSEYQYYEFRAIDRPLTAAEQEKLRSSSTRAKITATSFVNEYNWGDFKGDPDLWMDRYFDAFLYVASWGQRTLKLRVPAKILALKTVRPYCVDRFVSARAKGDNVILTFESRDEDGDFGDYGNSKLAPLLGVREELARGDLRALYLGWLACAQSQVIGDEQLEPVVPPGLAKLSAAQSKLAAFLLINPDLLAAAKTSAPHTTSDPTPDAARKWIAKLPVTEKNALLARVIAGDAQVSRELDLRMRKETTRKETTKPSTAKRRTVGELTSELERLADERERAEQARDAKREARRARELQAARDKQLDALAGREPSLWKLGRRAHREEASEGVRGRGRAPGGPARPGRASQRADGVRSTRRDAAPRARAEARVHPAIEEGGAVKGGAGVARVMNSCSILPSLP